MSYLIPISKSEKDNLSGLLQLRVARVDDIQTFPRIIGGRVAGDIFFKPGAGFVPWEVIPESSSFKSDSTDSIEGVYKNGQLSFTIIFPEESLLDRMERDRFVVFYLDGNLQPVLFGSPSKPLLFRYSHQTGSIGSGRNEYSGVFYSTAPKNKAVYQGAVSDFVPLLVVRSESMDGEVLATLGEGQSVNLNSDFAFKEVMMPLLPNHIGKYATIHYTRAGVPMSSQFELGKTLIITSDFSFEFELV